MEEQGIFRSALGGFNKADVLTYIDEITARWEVERQQLQQELNEAQQALTDARQQTAEQAAQIEAAQETVRQQTDSLNTLHGQLAEQTRLAEELPSLRQQLAVLEAQRREQDEAAARASARCRELEQTAAQMREQQERATAEMMAAEERLSARTAELTTCTEQLDAARSRIARYEAVLGRADAMERHMDGLVRPFLEETAATADRSLAETRAALEDIRQRLNRLSDELSRRQNALCNTKAATDERLKAVLTDWLLAAGGSDDPADADTSAPNGTPDERFFR